MPVPPRIASPEPEIPSSTEVSGAGSSRPAAARGLGDRVLRASTAWRAVLADRLEPDERETLGDDPDLWGVLVPVGEPAGRSVRALGHDTALLLFSLAEPGRLPAYVRREPGGERQVAELVLDGVLQVEHDGRFVAGSEALEALDIVPLSGHAPGGPATPGTPGDGRASRLGRRSLEALRWAARLDCQDARLLSAKLYSYGRVPLTPTWQRRLPDSESVLDHLGWRNLQGWRHGVSSQGWISFAPSGSFVEGRSKPVTSTAGTTWKLYVSPRPEHLAAVAGLLPGHLEAAGAVAFKVGSEASGLLRPDKIVAYFDRFETLAAAADGLTDAFAGVPAHGVPFSAEIAGDGLLSWGVDPPRAERPPGGSGGQSWRLWVTNRLAGALLAARGQGVEEPWRFALERLRFEGVDVERWVPASSLWSGIDRA